MRGPGCPPPWVVVTALAWPGGPRDSPPNATLVLLRACDKGVGPTDRHQLSHVGGRDAVPPVLRSVVQGSLALGFRRHRCQRPTQRPVSRLTAMPLAGIRTRAEALAPV